MNIELSFSDLPPLTEYCDCDNGVRSISKDDVYGAWEKTVPCRQCDCGERPTEFGRAVLDLVRRFAGKETP